MSAPTGPSVWVISSSYPRHPTDSTNAGVLARDLALSLLQENFQVRVVVPDKPGGITVDPGLDLTVIRWIWPSIELADINSRSLRDVVRASSLMASGLVTVRRVARKESPSAVIALWGLPSGIFARSISARSDAEYVVWLLGSDVWRARGLPFGQRVLKKVLTNSAASFADGVELAEAASQMTGVDVEFLPSVREIPHVGSRPETSYDYLFVGRYHPNKGPDVLIEALALASQNRFRPKVGLFGSGSLEPSLHRQVESHGLSDTVKVNPPIDAIALRGLLGSVRALVIPSRVESIPLVLGDAIQARTPVIVSEVGDMGNIVDQFHLGITVPPEHPELLATALQVFSSEEVEPPDWESAGQLFHPRRAMHRILDSLQIPTEQRSPPPD